MENNWHELFEIKGVLDYDISFSNNPVRSSYLKICDMKKGDVGHKMKVQYRYGVNQPGNFEQAFLLKKCNICKITQVFNKIMLNETIQEPIQTTDEPTLQAFGWTVFLASKHKMYCYLLINLILLIFFLVILLYFYNK